MMVPEVLAVKVKPVSSQWIAPEEVKELIDRVDEESHYASDDG